MIYGILTFDRDGGSDAADLRIFTDAVIALGEFDYLARTVYDISSEKLITIDPETNRVEFIAEAYEDNGAEAVETARAFMNLNSYGEERYARISAVNDERIKYEYGEEFDATIYDPESE